MNHKEFNYNQKLEEAIVALGTQFEALKKRLIKDKFDNAENLNSISDIPKVKLFELIDRIKKIKD